MSIRFFYISLVISNITKIYVEIIAIVTERLILLGFRKRLSQNS